MACSFIAWKFLRKRKPMRDFIVRYKVDFYIRSIEYTYIIRSLNKSLLKSFAITWNSAPNDVIENREFSKSMLHNNNIQRPSISSSYYSTDRNNHKWQPKAIFPLSNASWSAMAVPERQRLLSATWQASLRRNMWQHSAWRFILWCSTQIAVPSDSTFG